MGWRDTIKPAQAEQPKSWRDTISKAAGTSEPAGQGISAEDSFMTKAGDKVLTQVQMASDGILAGFNSLPGADYIRKGAAAIEAPFKGQTYAETAQGYIDADQERWDRTPVLSGVMSLASNATVPGINGIDKYGKAVKAISKIGATGLVSAADNAGRDSTGLDLEDAIDSGTLAAGIQAGVEALPYVSKVVKPVARFVRDKVGSVGFGVRGDASREYLENPDQMRKVIDSGEDALLDLKNQVDETYQSKVADPLRDAKSGYDEAVMDFADQKARLKNTRPPEELAPEIISRVKDLNKGLSEQSSKAFETLDGVKFERQGLSDLVDNLKSRQLIDGKPPTMGDRLASYNALSKVQKMINADPSLSKSTIDQIIQNSDLKASDLKMIIQAMQDDAESAFTTYGSRTAGGKIKNLAGAMNKQLKDTVPAYAEAMEPLAADTQLVSGLREIFADEETARAALRSTANPDTGRQVKMLLQSLDKRAGTQYAKMLEDYIEAQSMIRNPERANALKAFALNPAKRAISEAEQNASKFSRMGVGSSENSIKSASRPNNFETKKQLSELMGDDFLDSINQYGLGQDFLKTSTNGSRKVNLGGIIGGPLGAILGGVTDIHGGKMWQTILDGQLKAAQLADTVAPKFRPILEQAEKQGARTLAATYYAIMNGNKAK